MFCMAVGAHLSGLALASTFATLNIGVGSGLTLLTPTCFSCGSDGGALHDGKTGQLLPGVVGVALNFGLGEVGGACLDGEGGTKPEPGASGLSSEG